MQEQEKFADRATAPAALAVGVDVGGTFTDVICHDRTTGTLLVGKSATVPDDPAAGVITALEHALQGRDIATIERFAHGSTVGLNAILQRRGSVVGLLCTAGFRDVLEIGRGTHEDAFDLLWKPLPPLVPRRLRLPVGERIGGDGSVVRPLDPADVAAAVACFADEGVDSVAVCFLSSWRNPAHEQAAGKLLRALGFAGEITLSSELSREYREFERTSTAVVNAYIRGGVSTYLAALEKRLRDGDCAADITIMRSGGGTMTIDEAQRRPFEAIFSGPVAGVEAAARIARELGLATAISADVGGTSYDTALIVDGEPDVLTEGRVAGLPIQSSWIDVRSIGAGGGSIGHIDEGGLLRVGPRSAGAVPGPAAYGRGGTEPTVTDAAAVMGMLGRGSLGGNVELDLSRAADALRPLAATLGLGLDETARGVLRITTAAMGGATREISVERGIDIRTAGLVLFGGAGPLFATLLATELECATVVIPPAAGIFSAWGLLLADVVRESAQTFLAPLTDKALAEADGIAEELLAGFGDLDGAEIQIATDLRYRGQEHTMRVPVPPPGTSERGRTLARLFHARYAEVFFEPLAQDVEVVAVRVSVIRRTAAPARRAAPATSMSATCHDEVEAYSFTRGERTTFAVVDRAALGSGATVRGPAIVTEKTTTTYLDAGFGARVDPSTACLLVERCPA